MKRTNLIIAVLTMCVCLFNVSLAFGWPERANVNLQGGDLILRNLPEGNVPFGEIIIPEGNPNLWVRSSEFLGLNSNVDDVEDGNNVDVEWYAYNTVSGTLNHIPCDGLITGCAYRLIPEPGVCETRYFISLKVIDTDGMITHDHAYAHVYNLSCEGPLEGTPYYEINTPDLIAHAPRYCESVLEVENKNSWTEVGPTKLWMITDSNTFTITVPPLKANDSVYLDIPAWINTGYDADGKIEVVVDAFDNLDEYYSRIAGSYSYYYNGELNNTIFYDKCRHLRRTR